MGIAKKAKGLQRFMLDCGFWQSPSWKGLRKVAVIGLQSAAVSYCNEHLTDGRLPGPAEELASSLGLQERDIKAPLQLLIDKKRWLYEDDEYVIVGYLDHNPSRSEVLDDRQRRATAGAKANHDRWHVEKGVVDPSCDLCRSDERSDSDSTTDVDDIPCEASKATEATEGSKPKDVSPSSSSVSEEPPPPEPQDDDDEIDEIRQEAWDRYWGLPDHIRNEVTAPERYVNRIVSEIIEHGGIPKLPEAPKLSVVRCDDPRCHNSIIELDDGSAAPCPSCNPRAKSA